MMIVSMGVHFGDQNKFGRDDMLKRLKRVDWRSYAGGNELLSVLGEREVRHHLQARSLPDGIEIELNLLECAELLLGVGLVEQLAAEIRGDEEAEREADRAERAAAVEKDMADKLVAQERLALLKGVELDHQAAYHLSQTVPLDCIEEKAMRAHRLQLAAKHRRRLQNPLPERVSRRRGGRHKVPLVDSNWITESRMIF